MTNWPPWEWSLPITLATGLPVEDTKIYNNVFVIPETPAKDRALSIVDMNTWGGPWPENTWFANSVFYVEGTSDFHYLIVYFISFFSQK